MYADEFKFTFAPDISVDNNKGYEIISKFIIQLSEFLKEKGVEDKIMVHVHDEPDSHYKGDLKNRIR